MQHGRRANGIHGIRYLGKDSLPGPSFSGWKIAEQHAATEKSWTVTRHGHFENTILNAGTYYGIIRTMGKARKITIEVPEDLLKKAQRASGSGVTQTVRAGLQLMAASEAYARLLQFRGKVRFSRSVEELKDDR